MSINMSCRINYVFGKRKCNISWCCLLIAAHCKCKLHGTNCGRKIMHINCRIQIWCFYFIHLYLPYKTNLIFLINLLSPAKREINWLCPPFWHFECLSVCLKLSLLTTLLCGSVHVTFCLCITNITTRLGDNTNASAYSHLCKCLRRFQT